MGHGYVNMVEKRKYVVLETLKAYLRVFPSRISHIPIVNMISFNKHCYELGRLRFPSSHIHWTSLIRLTELNPDKITSLHLAFYTAHMTSSSDTKTLMMIINWPKIAYYTTTTNTIPTHSSKRVNNINNSPQHSIANSPWTITLNPVWKNKKKRFHETDRIPITYKDLSSIWFSYLIYKVV